MHQIPSPNSGLCILGSPSWCLPKVKIPVRVGDERMLSGALVCAHSLSRTFSFSLCSVSFLCYYLAEYFVCLFAFTWSMLILYQGTSFLCLPVFSGLWALISFSFTALRLGIRFQMSSLGTWPWGINSFVALLLSIDRLQVKLSSKIWSTSSRSLFTSSVLVKCFKFFFFQCSFFLCFQRRGDPHNPLHYYQNQSLYFLLFSCFWWSWCIQMLSILSIS